MKKCTYCGYNKFTKFQRIKEYDLFICMSCGLLLTEIPIKLTQKEVNTDVYSDEYLKMYEERQMFLIDRFVSKVKLIDKYACGGHILDVGCSTGLFLQTVGKYSKYKWIKYGIDINKKSIRIAKSKKIGHLIYTDLHHKPFPDNYFDVVTCFDILEHDKDLKGNLREIRKILKPNGILLIQVPNYTSLMAKLCGDIWDWWAVPDHVYHFSPNLLKNILINYGFKYLKSFTWEDKKDFIQNIRGTIKNKFSKICNLNRIISLLITPILIILFYSLRIVENFVSVGGLHVIMVTKKNNVS
jgi:ubiquinone/menaquinone biosynthesis C-methylase UbiE